MYESSTDFRDSVVIFLATDYQLCYRSHELMKWKFIIHDMCMSCVNSFAAVTSSGE